jgi:hypothetical protein
MEKLQRPKRLAEYPFGEWRARRPGSQSEAMLKVAYFAFLAALIATPVHLATGNSATRAVVLGLLLVSAVFAAIGFQRRP